MDVHFPAFLTFRFQWLENGIHRIVINNLFCKQKGGSSGILKTSLQELILANPS